MEILSSDVLEVTLDDTYGGKERNAIRTGTPNGATDRVVIKTKKRSFNLYTTNYISIKNKILS
ncbi:hypothetical protein CJ195_27395 [Bacillus sp. UMB0899]|nr:hypothetical protein CJ195_27395 [Bacillus sp. UMB0899]